MIITLNDEPGRCISDHDLAVLADWANKQRHLTPNVEFKQSFSMLREGADLLLRKRARATNYENPIERKTL